MCEGQRDWLGGVVFGRFWEEVVLEWGDFFFKCCCEDSEYWKRITGFNNAGGWGDIDEIQ